MKKKIIEILDKYTDAHGFVSTSEYIRRRNDKVGQLLDHSFLDEYKTIITLGLAYPSTEVKYKGKGYGILSRYSYGTDYHIVFRKILKDIEQELQELGIRTSGSVDISKINERAAALFSNLGFFGKSQFIIHPVYGSYMYLATILIDIDVEKNIVVMDDCGSCTKCIDACPGDALIDGDFIEEKCISYISQEKKPFNIEETKLFKTMIYGCDICQKVCPKNKGIDFHIHEEFEPTGIENLDIPALLKMSNKEYKNIYGQNASSWKGPLILKRNAICMLNNHRLFEYLPLIKEISSKYKDVSWYNETAELIIKQMESE